MITQRKRLFAKSIQFSGFMIFIVLSFVTAALFIATPLTLNILVQEVGSISILNIAFIAGLLMLGHALQIGIVFLKNRMVQKYHVRTTSYLYRDVFNLKYDAYLEMGPSTLQSRVYDAVDAYAKFYFDTVPGLIINTVMIIATIIITLTISPIIAIVLFVNLPINYFGYKLLNKKLGRLSVKLSAVCSQAWKDENAIISQIDFIKQNADNNYLLPSIERHKNSAQEITRKVNNYANGMSGVISAINQIIKNILILLLAVMMLADPEFVGGMLFIILVLPYFFTAVSGLVNTNLNFSALVAADDFYNFLKKETELMGNETIQQVNDIQFCIDSLVVGNKVLAKDIKMNFKKGDIVGIRGESGMGKSTLAKLIAKFRHTDGISINGTPLSQLSNKEYLKMVSYFSQNTPVITDTILNNLNFGRDPVDERAYRQLKFLDKFENFQEEILENGANLSGGDKQRIAMARLFVEKPQIVVLDEPTNSLDKNVEKEILSEIFEKFKDSIIFFISHDHENMHYCTHTATIADNEVVIACNY